MVESAFQNAKVFRKVTSRLSFATSSDTPSSAEASKSGLVAHWRDYPLSTANEVQQWAQEAVEGLPTQFTLSPSRGDGVGIPDVPRTPQDSITTRSTPISVNDEGSTTTTFMDDSDVQVTVTSDVHPWESSSRSLQEPETFPTSQLMPTSSQMNPQNQKTDNAMGLSEDFKKQYIW